MDVNYLYCRQQMELMRAEQAACPEARAAHRGLAEGYARRIAEARTRVVHGAGWPAMEAK